MGLQDQLRALGLSQLLEEKAATIEVLITIKEELGVPEEVAEATTLEETVVPMVVKARTAVMDPQVFHPEGRAKEQQLEHGARRQEHYTPEEAAEVVADVQATVHPVPEEKAAADEVVMVAIVVIGPLLLPELLTLVEAVEVLADMTPVMVLPEGLVLQVDLVLY